MGQNFIGCALQTAWSYRLWFCCWLGNRCHLSFSQELLDSRSRYKGLCNWSLTSWFFSIWGGYLLFLFSFLRLSSRAIWVRWYRLACGNFWFLRVFSCAILGSAITSLCSCLPFCGKAIFCWWFTSLFRSTFCSQTLFPPFSFLFFSCFSRFTFYDFISAPIQLFSDFIFTAHG